MISSTLPEFLGKTLNLSKMMRSLFSYPKLPSISNTSELMTKDDKDWLEDKNIIRANEE